MNHVLANSSFLKPIETYALLARAYRVFFHRKHCHPLQEFVDEDDLDASAYDGRLTRPPRGDGGDCYDGGQGLELVDHLAVYDDRGVLPALKTRKDDSSTCSRHRQESAPRTGCERACRSHGRGKDSPRSHVHLHHRRYETSYLVSK